MTIVYLSNRNSLEAIQKLRHLKLLGPKSYPLTPFITIFSYRTCPILNLKTGQSFLKGKL